jgi:hypothetical protein
MIDINAIGNAHVYPVYSFFLPFGHELKLHLQDALDDLGRCIRDRRRRDESSLSIVVV